MCVCITLSFEGWPTAPSTRSLPALRSPGRVLPQRVRSAYALAAARSQDGETLISLCELLIGVLRELQLHAGYAKELKIELARVQPYRAVAAYTDFLLAIAWQRGRARRSRP